MFYPASKPLCLLGFVYQRLPVRKRSSPKRRIFITYFALRTNRKGGGSQQQVKWIMLEFGVCGLMMLQQEIPEEKTE